MDIRKILETDNAVAIDTETTGLIPWGTPSDPGLVFPARPFAVSWCDMEGETDYVSWEVEPHQRKVLYDDNKKAVKRVNRLLSDPDTVKVFHNAAFDLNMFLCAGFTEIRGPIIDTQTMAHIATHGSEMVYSLKPICKKFFDFSDEDRHDLEDDVKAARNEAKLKGWRIAEGKEFGKQPFLADFWLGDPELVERYARQDVERTMLCFQFFGPKILEDEGLLETLEREYRLSLGPVRQMETTGIRIFPKKLGKLRVFYETYRQEQRVAIDKLAGPDFNPRSGKQKQVELIHKRGLKPLKWTKPSKTYPEGQPKMDGEFLQHYAESENPDPLCRAILEYVNAAYAISNFIEPYSMFMSNESPGVSVLHPNIRTTAAITGRMGSSDPNLMNVASEDTGRKRSKIGLKPREALGPRPDHIWYLPDYSQIEVWLFAFMSGSKTMLDLLMSGEDFHGGIARRVWGDEDDFLERKGYWRKRAKLVMFGKLYGGGIAKLATLLDESEAEAAEFIGNFERQIPDIPLFMKRMIRKAQRQGFIQNPYGRCYDIPDGLAYRAVNYLIQGTAADILKEALNNIYYNLICDEWRRMKILLSMHDEVLLEVPLAYHSKELMRAIIVEMQRAGERLGLPRPLPVGMKIAKSRWHKTREIELEEVA